MRKARLFIVFLTFLSTVGIAHAAINVNIISPSSGWNANYDILLNITTNDYANVTFNTTAYTTLTTLYTNETQGNLTLNSTYLNEANNTIYVYATNATNSGDLAADNVANVAVDLTSPTWNETLNNQINEYGTSFTYTVNASDSGIGIDQYFINDTTNFQINSATRTITNKTVVPIGTYDLNISVNDSLNHVNSSVITITIQDTTSPAWNETLNNQTVERGSSFSYIVNASDLSGISTYFINDTTNFAITGRTIINNTALPVRIYWLNISVNDTYNNINSSIIRINLSDTTMPNITSTSPSGTLGYSTISLNATTDENASCRYSTTDINYTNMTGNFEGTGTLHNKTLTLANNNYVYYVRCNDSYGNVMNYSTNITFTINVGNGGTTGGGGGSSSTPTIVIEPNITIEFQNEFAQARLTTDDVGNFDLDGEAHEIKVTKIEDLPTIVLKSKIYRFQLELGQTKKFDMDEDPSNYDLAVTLDDILEDAIDITLKKIDELIPEGEEPEADILTEEELALSEVVEEVAPPVKPAEEEKGGTSQLNNILIKTGMIVLIVIIIIALYILKKKKKF